MTQHTPGPWSIQETNRGTMVYGAVDGGPVARIERVSDREHPNAADDANARLIAQAPALLEIARKLANRLGDYGVITNGLAADAEQARDALRAVEGN